MFLNPPLLVCIGKKIVEAMGSSLVDNHLETFC